jgi:hypothetical protein
MRFGGLCMTGKPGSGWMLHYAIGLSDLKCEQALAKDWANSIRLWLEGKLLVALLLEALLVKGESFFPWGYSASNNQGSVGGVSGERRHCFSI